MAQSFHGETPFTINRKKTLSKTPMDLTKLLAVDRPATTVATVGRATYHLTKIEAGRVSLLRRRSGFPAYLYQAKGDRSVENRLLSSSSRVDVRPGANPGYTNQMASEGCVVCAPDLRGIGRHDP